MAVPLKVGMLGTRGIARNHMTPYLTHPDRVRLTAVCDMVEPLAREYAKDAGVDAVYTDLDDMLRNADIEAVDICTNHAAHVPCTIAAVRAGKHVLVEKAMANTLQGCRDMVEAADKAGVTLMIAHQLRHSREATAVKRFIDEGRLGEIQAVRTHVTMGGPKRGWMCDAKPGGGVPAAQLHPSHRSAALLRRKRQAGDGGLQVRAAAYGRRCRRCGRHHPRVRERNHRRPVRKLDH